MTASQPIDLIMANVMIPTSLLKSSDGFGGTSINDCVHGDLVVRNGHVFGMKQTALSNEATRMVLPRLTEVHVHLDKCHTASRMKGVGGDLQAAIEKQRADKDNWTAEDIRSRVTRGLDELIEAGCARVRSHVDWTGLDGQTSLPLAWHVLNETGQDYRRKMNLQVSPLIGVEQYAEIGFAERVASELSGTEGVLGVFVFDQLNRREGILAAVKAAEKFGLALDFHVDEGLSDGLDGLELIADVVLEVGYQGSVLCGHACSLMNLEPVPLEKLAEKLCRSGIAVASLPVTNLYLQGRTTGTPDRRGVTRICELQSMGIPVVVGTDNVRDAFCPFGVHDPLRSLMHAALAAHLDPPYGEYLPMITTLAEKAIGLESTYVDGASIEDLIVFDAQSTNDLLSAATRPVSMSNVLQGEGA